MISKEVLVLFLLSGTLQILAFDNSDEAKELLNSHEHHNKQFKHGQSDERREIKHVQDSVSQFQKDYSRWGEKAHKKHNFNKGHDDHVKYNMVDTDEYIDKHNKNGKTFNPDLVKIEKFKMYQKKREEMKEHHDTEVENTGNLMHDLKVNYVDNKKKVSPDSEIISEYYDKKNKEQYQENYQNKNDMYMKRSKKDFLQGVNKMDLTQPPPANETILMARYIVHTVDWAALATLSARSATKGAPFVCVKATSDGMKNESSGIPFFYMSPMDLCTQDLQKDNRVSVLVTLSETDYCKKQNLDPQDPRCAKLTLSGKIKRIKPGSDEEKFARNALFSRHPAMESWPADHDWYFTKLKIGQIILLDQFGGATYIKVKDYLNGRVTEPEVRQK